MTNFAIRQIRQLWACRTGSAAVEFVAVASLLAVMLLGLSDTGSLVWKHFQLTKGANAAAQHALIARNDDAGIVASAYQASGLSPDDTAVELVRYCQCPTGEAVACNQSCPQSGYKRFFLVLSLSHDHQTGAGTPLTPSTVTLFRSVTVQLP